MAKWADYRITAVSYNSKHTHIDQVKAFKDFGDSLGEEKVYSREIIVNSINTDITFCTMVKNSKGMWDKGQKVFIINVNGASYIKTVDNGNEADNLENLPEF